MVALITQSALAQTYTVLHSFTGAPDGANPVVGLTVDKCGNLYGTTWFGGNTGGNCGPMGCGTVFRLRRSGSGWTFASLYKFSRPDGLGPQGRVAFGPDGTLYGTTANGQGDSCSCGNVFNLKPSPTRPQTPLIPWVETVIHQFSASPGEGIDPTGDLAFDPAGNLYGTTVAGGYWNHCGGGIGCGTVYELTPSAGAWTENVIYTLKGGTDGTYPSDGVVLDSSGNLYVTSSEGHYDDNAQWGAIFELSPSGSGWTETTLYDFQNGAGIFPQGGLIRDTAGNLYGATPATGGSGGGGTVYQLTLSNGGWSFQNLYTLTGGSGRSGPFGKLLMDAAGNLYGTTHGEDAYNKGSVFKLTPGNGGWTLTSLHDFTGGSDGANPEDGLVMDANGNLYGTTYVGGTASANCQEYQCGVVFEITP
jgi:uncharacterized repeat protein (TIGR03803 family)